MIGTESRSLQWARREGAGLFFCTLLIQRLHYLESNSLTAAVANRTEPLPEAIFGTWHAIC
jgi:hypothetical protein